MACYDALQKYPLGTKTSTGAVNVSFRVSPYDPGPYFVASGARHSVGAFSDHIGDILGRDEAWIMEKARA